ncbi:DNA topoisomerase 3 (plasmid) [Peptoclostridium acidaminophilum DSM 3953]|uniref:DNA topoisomerase n=1 Tax=Peptoclostridium acidaminophilum DSM 3953 TaxID=1286171 RepID=W8T7U0_PEPAC|nr:DNA topoisomerase 3 [Peptoclostridium acidaminophilum]AHM57799.1 DNA topoisomerase 3 [Peptoclostridium acidaminophilum DSM 3953]
MSKQLYITEKPSVANSFANALGFNITQSDRGRGYAEAENAIITWCFGHLITMAYPDAYNPAYKSWRVEHLPIIPEEYKYVVIDNKGTVKQFEVIKSLMSREDVDIIYACTDSGREGEYIFRLVYNQIGSSKPAKRVWISSQTEDAVKKGIQEAKSISEYDSLAKAAYCRAKEDWLFGMNFSRMYTCQYGRKLSAFLKEEKSAVIPIGRVMTCVLGLIVDRELEIRNFVPRPYYGVTATFLSKDSEISYKGRWQQKKKKEKNPAEDQEDEDKYISKDEAEDIIKKLEGKEAIVKKVEVKVKKEQAPLLFNLAELQSEANKKFKLSVNRTLEIAQSLYEKKLISYPRTDSRVLSTDVVPELPRILNGLYGNADFRAHTLRIKEFGKLAIDKKTKRYVDDSKVTDHYAIIPTYVTTELARLDEDTRNVYSLIVKRFLAIFYPPAEYNTVRVETGIDSEIFVTNSKVLNVQGWKEVYEVTSSKKEELSDSPIQKLIKKEKCDVTGFELEEKETRPPSRFTDGSLIITMEKAGKYIENEELREQIKTCGIGTSATRAGIIKKLVDIGHIKINPKTQIITPEPKGEAIVQLVRLTAKELLNPILTASWEKGLFMIENHEITEDVFDEKLTQYINRTIEKIKRTGYGGRLYGLE